VGEHEVDVVVIGMGPGGEYAAGELAESGLEVAGVEDSLVGGECPYWGCVPSKMMLRAADLLAEGRRIPGMAGASMVRQDWAPVAGRLMEATDNWDDVAAAERFTGKGGRLFRGHGRIIAPGQVAVGDDVLHARRGIVIATGSAPSIPPIPGLADTPYWTNHQAVEATRVPESLIVLGGGAIGSELAQVFSRFGAEVTVVEALGRLLSAEEPEAGALLAEVFGREGIGVRTGVAATGVAHHGERPGSGFTLMSMITCAPRPVSGRSATWSGKGPSRTCPCTTRPSWWRTSSAGSITPPSTTRCRGSRSPTRRSARSA
jgi:pyruvate/2-oxoglutarate dehydrogenase complex dihydrolipoamide dehydrogenase (E3) component